MLADRREKTARTPADAIGVLVSAEQPIHVGSRTADITNAAPEPGFIGKFSDFGRDRIFTAGLDRFALVHGNGAEGTTAEAAPMTGNGCLDLFPGRYLLEIRWMRRLLERQRVDRIHISLGKRQSWWGRDQQTVAVALGNCPAGTGILFVAGHSKRLGKQSLIGRNILIGRNFNHILPPPCLKILKAFMLAGHPARSPNGADIVDLLSGLQPLNNVQ